MRTETQDQIDALHQQLAAIAMAEKMYWDACNPGASWMESMSNHNKIDLAARSPRDRALMFVASAKPEDPVSARGVSHV